MYIEQHGSPGGKAILKTAALHTQYRRGNNSTFTGTLLDQEHGRSGGKRTIEMAAPNMGVPTVPPGLPILNTIQNVTK